MTRRSRYALAAVVLLAIAAFGGLSVGWPLVYAQLTIPELADEELGVSLIPVVALAYGLVSLAGAVGIWRRSRWATPLVVASQGFVALALFVIYAEQPRPLTPRRGSDRRRGGHLCPGRRPTGRAATT